MWKIPRDDAFYYTQQLYNTGMFHLSVEIFKAKAVRISILFSSFLEIILRINDACRETGLVGGKIGKLFHLNDQDKMRLISNRLLYCVSPSLLLIHN